MPVRLAGNSTSGLHDEPGLPCPSTHWRFRSAVETQSSCPRRRAWLRRPWWCCAQLLPDYVSMAASRKNNNFTAPGLIPGFYVDGVTSAEAHQTASGQLTLPLHWATQPFNKRLRSTPISCVGCALLIRHRKLNTPACHSDWLNTLALVTFAPLSTREIPYYRAHSRERLPESILLIWQSLD